MREREMVVEKLPHVIEAEQALLGAILMDNRCLDRCDGLDAKHFFDPLHAQIFESASRMIAGGKMVSPITLKPLFNEHDPVEGDMTVFRYMGKLVIEATTLSEVRNYAKTIRETFTRREIMQVAADMLEAAQYAVIGTDPSDIVTRAESSLYACSEPEKFGRGAVSFADAMTGALEQFEAAATRADGLSGMSTGLKCLDQMMGGLVPSNLIIVAGRPAMGKTAISVKMAMNASLAKMHDKTKGAATGIFSMEMSDSELASRMISDQASVSSEKLKRGQATPDEMQRVAEASKILRRLPMHIDSTGGLSIAQLSARARKMKRQHDIGLLVIDYIQLMSGGKGDNRVQAITDITMGLKALAKELNIPVIALSQLSREVEKRDNKRPILSDLRDSGSIEQDADIVMFCYREEYYLNQAKPAEDDKYFDGWLGKMKDAKGKAEIIIGKQRHGSAGTVHCGFEGKYTRFHDL